MPLIKPDRTLRRIPALLAVFFQLCLLFPLRRGRFIRTGRAEGCKGRGLSRRVHRTGSLFPAHSQVAGWVFAPFFLMLVASSLIHAPQTGLKEQCGKRQECGDLHSDLSDRVSDEPRTRDRLLHLTFAVFCFSPRSRSACSLFAFDWSGGVLWLGHVFAGLIANPNSFSLMINLAMAVLLVRLADAGNSQFPLIFSVFSRSSQPPCFTRRAGASSRSSSS